MSAVHESAFGEHKEEGLEEKKTTIIIAPHPDDEVIGCYEILIDTKPLIMYHGETDLKRRKEVLSLHDYLEIQGLIFQNNLPPIFHKKNCTIYSPDPIHEIHPLHRALGTMYEQYARNGFDVIFYNTTMRAPYIHEVEKSEEKKDLLNKVYHKQGDLWKYDHRYFLFEGRCKWIF